MTIATVGLAAELRAHAERHGPVTLGVVGAGQMGTDLAVQCALMPGIRLGAICASTPTRVETAMAMSGLAWSGAETPAAVDRAIEAGRVAYVQDFRDLCASGHVQVVIDATGNPNTGTMIALEAFRNGKHVVMLNVEADITIGRLLKREAARAGVVYTGAAGDEPAATVELIGLAQVLCPKADGGILSRSGCVDYTIGKGVAPGVFAIVRPSHPRVLERITDLKVGPGPCYTLSRPFHLTSLEVPLSAIKAVRSSAPDLQPIDHPVAECAAVSKRDLKPGDVLGKIGETDYRGFAMTWSDARGAQALPLGLAEKARVTRPIAKGEKLTYANCVPEESFIVTRMRRDLDAEDARFLPEAAA